MYACLKIQNIRNGGCSIIIFGHPLVPEKNVDTLFFSCNFAVELDK